MFLTDNQKRIYRHYQQTVQILKSRADAGDGTLSPKEMGNYIYCSFPYLLLEDNEDIAERMADIMVNAVEITENGEIAESESTRLARHDELYYGLLNEVNMRQLLKAAFTPFTTRLNSYFESGAPSGIAMCAAAGSIPQGSLVRFSKVQYIQELHEQGSIRISPAAYYKDDPPEDAMRDDECDRPFKIKALLDVLDGKSTIEVDGMKVPIENGFVNVSTPIDNYYMLCSCKSFSRRMPTDFKADAALIITDKNEFLKRLNKAISSVLPRHEFLEGDVTYYDPYNDLPDRLKPELYKHFAYTYQQEHRCVWRANAFAHDDNLEHLYLTMGSLTDISYPVYA